MMEKNACQVHQNLCNEYRVSQKTFTLTERVRLLNDKGREVPVMLGTGTNGDGKAKTVNSFACLP